MASMVSVQCCAQAQKAYFAVQRRRDVAPPGQGYCLVSLIELFLSRLARAPAVLVSVESTQGSVPRGAGTWMAVFADALVGTIGGGRLEFDAVAEARAQLGGAAGPS